MPVAGRLSSQRARMLTGRSGAGRARPAPRCRKRGTCQPRRGVLEFRPQDASHESDHRIQLRFHLSPAAGGGNRLGRTQPIPKNRQRRDGLAVFFYGSSPTPQVHTMTTPNNFPVPAPADRTSLTDDERIEDVVPLPPPEHLIRFFPIQGTAVEKLVAETRARLKAILNGRSDR